MPSEFAFAVAHVVLELALVHPFLCQLHPVLLLALLELALEVGLGGEEHSSPVAQLPSLRAGRYLAEVQRVLELQDCERGSSQYLLEVEGRI